jgi:hypothetical protein
MIGFMSPVYPPRDRQLTGHPQQTGTLDDVTPAQAIELAGAALRVDLEHTEIWTPATSAALDAALVVRQTWVDAWPDGAEHVPGLVAQDVQEFVRAEFDPHWPLCPDHRNHALFVEPDLGADPFWVCEVTGLPVAPIGGL